MTEALKLLERKVEAAIATEEQIVLPPNSVGTTPAFEAKMPRGHDQDASSLYGFALPEVDITAKVREKMKNRRRGEIDNYRHHAGLLRQAMAKVGVEPIAVITAAAWNKIVANYGLYTVTPNKYGCVTLGEGWVGSVRKAPAWLWVAQTLLVLTVWAGLATAAVLLLPTMIDWGPGGVLVGFGFAVLAAITIGVTTALRQNIVANKLVPWRVKRLVATYSHEQLLQLVAPNHLLAGNEYSNTTKVAFPTPPADVTKIVQSGLFSRQLVDGMYPLTLKVAAEAGAIQFVGGWEKALGAKIEQVKAYEEMIRRDPILYTEYGSAVAILAQYGPELALEVAAIDAVVNSEHLL